MISGNGDQERIATLGGTFDPLHAGHKEYIHLAFEYTGRVLIYVTSDEYTKGTLRDALIFACGKEVMPDEIHFEIARG
jgi:cytidyltransferase-like protein